MYYSPNEISQDYFALRPVDEVQEEQQTRAGASFRLEPGTAIGIAGPSASGKSTLARALAGIWTPRGGKMSLTGAALEQYGEKVLARHLGWLPQEVVLFEGTVAENIARLMPEPDPEAVIAAARHAGAHEMIPALPGGDDFGVAAGGAALSGGQRQRIALARAFYGEPVVVVLDEPDVHLDAEGATALNGAIARLKARGGAAVIVAHRPTTFTECDTVYVMKRDRQIRSAAPEPGVSGPPARNGARVLRAQAGSPRVSDARGAAERRARMGGHGVDLRGGDRLGPGRDREPQPGGGAHRRRHGTRDSGVQRRSGEGGPGCWCGSTAGSCAPSTR